jgi:hypothetical protein
MVRDLLADERCRRALLDFLSTTDIERLVPALLRRTLRARRQSGNSGSGENDRRRGEPRLRGWTPRSRNLFLPTPAFIASAEED